MQHDQSRSGFGPAAVYGAPEPKRRRGVAVMKYGGTAAIALFVGVGMGASGQRPAAHVGPAPRVTVTASPVARPAPRVTVTATARATVTATVTARPAAPAGSGGGSGGGAADRGGASSTTHVGGPGGASARCVDGTYSYSRHRSGTCSHHHGVAVWY